MRVRKFAYLSLSLEENAMCDTCHDTGRYRVCHPDPATGVLVAGPSQKCPLGCSGDDDSGYDDLPDTDLATSVDMVE